MKNPFQLPPEQAHFAPELERASVDELFRRLRVGFWGLLFTLGVAYSALGETILQHSVVGHILLGIFVLVLLRIAVHLRVRHSADVRLRRWTYVVGSTLTACGFALLNIISYPLLQPTDVALLALIEVGICSAALMTMGSSFLPYMLYAVPNLGSLIVMIAIGPQTRWTQYLFLLSLIYLAALVALAMQQALSHRREVILRLAMAEMALRDNLTQLRNRRALFEFMSLEAEQVLRSWRKTAEPAHPKLASSLGVLMIDMDHFKTINDSHGHEAGDAVLVQLAQILCEAVRKPDLVIRWGGEEFVIIARDVDRNPPSRVAERVRARVEAHEFALPSGECIRRTCSIGYSVFPFTGAIPDLLGWEQVISVADAGMYRAKLHGRNRSVGIMPGPALDADSEVLVFLKRGLDPAHDLGVISLIE